MKKPTAKQKKAVELMVENGGNVSKAMRDAGYSPQTAKSPNKLTDSQSFADLLEAYLPDDMMLRALSDDIEKKEGNRTSELQLGFKLKGRMTEKVDFNGTLKVEVLSSEEKQALLDLIK